MWALALKSSLGGGLSRVTLKTPQRMEYSSITAPCGASWDQRGDGDIQQSRVWGLMPQHPW